MNSKRTGGVIQAWSTNNEQGFHMRMSGILDRRVVDWEGVELVEEVQTTKSEKLEVKNRLGWAEKNC